MLRTLENLRSLAATPVLAPPLVGGGGYDALVQLEG
jgi:hypothetical protein